MINLGKFKILENNITACDYDHILNKIDQAVTYKKKLLISPIASQTLVLSKDNIRLKRILDRFDYLVPDSQWVKWTLDWLYRIKLRDRVYGPDLMLKTCRLCEEKKWRVYLYGTNISTLIRLKEKLTSLYPRLKIVQTEPSKYRELTINEIKYIQNDILQTKAQVIFVGIGSPKQEILSEKLAKYNHGLKKIIIPVGAAFDFISGVKKQAPKWMGDIGFEWCFRLFHEFRRLNSRYLIHGFDYFIQIYIQKKYFH